MALCGCQRVLLLFALVLAASWCAHSAVVSVPGTEQVSPEDLLRQVNGGDTIQKETVTHPGDQQGQTTEPPGGREGGAEVTVLPSEGTAATPVTVDDEGTVLSTAGTTATPVGREPGGGDTQKSPSPVSRGRGREGGSDVSFPSNTVVTATSSSSSEPSLTLDTTTTSVVSETTPAAVSAESTTEAAVSDQPTPSQSASTSATPLTASEIPVTLGVETTTESDEVPLTLPAVTDEVPVVPGGRPHDEVPLDLDASLRPSGSGKKELVVPEESGEMEVHSRHRGEPAATAADGPDSPRPVGRHRDDPGLAPTDNKPSSRRTGVPDLTMLENQSKGRKGAEPAPVASPAFPVVEEPDRPQHKQPASPHPQTDSNLTKAHTSTIVGIVFIVCFVLVVGWFAYRKLRENWHRRHYRKMDFLVDGMYNL